MNPYRQSLTKFKIQPVPWVFFSFLKHLLSGDVAPLPSLPMFGLNLLLQTPDGRLLWESLPWQQELHLPAAGSDVLDSSQRCQCQLLPLWENRSKCGSLILNMMIMPCPFFFQITEVNGGYQFECQHGPRECHGNIVQACTIAYVRSSNTKVGVELCSGPRFT